MRLPSYLTAACTLALFALAAPARGADAGVEFFEKKIRPVLVQHCYRCHAATAKKVKGGLLLDSRGALLKGGDSGPALVPGRPDKSRIIEAVGYKNVDLQMPPKGKLPDAVLADLTAWVKMGAPWPRQEEVKGTPGPKAFDLLARKREHWAWQPVRVPPVPAVRNAAWPRSAVDRFILARLEDRGLTPAPEADRRTLLRRVYFDLVGLPPAPAAVEAFVNDTSPGALAKVVDGLLASPRFGERWGRHWLDLVRYAETRGHEFDYPTPNAWQYRDYVVRALNADVPYDQFVTEHVAGDLMPRPRLHPRDGFNESVLGTGFWFLGEEVHSPVDVRQDQADRLDNRVDVLTKTFLGLTVACARCHDHKFDAISTRDYYALFGFLESSSYRLVRFDTREHNRRVAAELAALRERARGRVQQALAEAVRPGVGRVADYLRAAREAVRAGPEFAAKGDVVFEDFESGTYDRWEVTGTAFGDRPQTLKTIAPYQGRINAVGTYFVNSHNIRPGGGVARGDAHTGKMTSRAFKVTHASITMLVGGGAHAGKTCVNLVVDGKVMRSATGRNDNRMFPVRWDVRAYKGNTARIEIVDNATGGWGNIGVDQIVFTDRTAGAPAAPARAEDFSDKYRRRLAEIARARKLDAKILGRWVVCLLAAAHDDNDPLHLWAKGAKDSKRLDAAPQKDAEVVVDYARCQPADWLPDGFAFGSRPVRPGDVSLGGTPARPVVRIADHAAAEKDATWDGLRVAPGSENDPGALGRLMRAGRMIRTPTFRVTTGKVFYLVRGSGQAYASVASHVMIAGPLHAQLVQTINAGERFRWVAHDLGAYKGLPAHVEFTPTRGDFAVARVVQADHMPPAVDQPNEALGSLLTGDDTSPDALATRYQRVFRDVTRRLADGRLDGTAHARLADWMLRHAGLFGADDGPLPRRVAEAVGPLLAEQAKIAGRIRHESRLALAMLDGSSVDEHVFIRGMAKSPGDLVPRRFLEALAGPGRLPAAHGSGRLELARQMTDPIRNPFLARVMVNRVWQHLFGRGIVASVDNFGVLGERPTHPALLDYVADRFVREGWSIKKLIRELVLTSTYRMASKAGGKADQTDPENLLLHRMRLRRLEGEAIRDAMLAVSGRLSDSMYGRPVPVHLTAFQEGRGRPASGPLDGDGRRSLYLAVRRNFLSPMLLAFDTPSPFSTVGRRTVSNVPAQALMLLNDPFVHQQAGLWARQVLATKGTATERIDAMYRRAFGRPPRGSELTACLDFLARQAEVRGGTKDDVAVWADLAHVLFNVKEFIFLN